MAGALGGRRRCTGAVLSPARVYARLPRFDGMIGTAAGFPVAVLTTIVAVVGGDSAHPAPGLIEFTVVTAIVAVMTTLPGALATAAFCWACYAGFLLGRHGLLVFDRASADAAVLLAGIAVIGTVGGIAGRLALAMRDTRAPHR